MRVSQVRRAARRRRRLRISAGVGVVALIAGGASAYLVFRDDSPPPPELRAEVVRGATGALPVATGPASYRIVYRVEAFEGDEATVSTEDISVQRPFDGRVVIREGEPPGTTVQFDGRSTYGRYANTQGAETQVAGDAPSVALGDLRLDVSLAELVADGTFVRRERRQALGRECQVYRTGSPLQSLRVAVATESDYVDACIDGTGRVLEEMTVKAGAVVQRLTATELVADPTFDPATFTVEGTAVGFDQGGALLTPIDATAEPALSSFRLPAAPEGFEYRGRFQLQTANQATPDSTEPVTSWVDVYVDGIDFFVVHQGPVTAEPDSSDATTARDVELGSLGAGRVLLAGAGTTVVAHPVAEGFVHVSGTLPSARLLELTRALRGP